MAKIASEPRRIESNESLAELESPKIVSDGELVKLQYQNDLLQAWDPVSSGQMSSARDGCSAVNKIGNLVDFRLANIGSELIDEAQTHFEHLEESIISQNQEKLSGLRINLVMDFNEVNGWFAMALYRMGARIKWASNCRQSTV